MNEDERVWHDWARILQRWGMKDWAVSILETTGPLQFLGAQAIYFAGPLLDFMMPTGYLDAMARILEDTSQAREFTNFLREIA